ncbi:ATP-grasp domain-containing protein [Kitasatospora atroaurantiaca]|uniref:Biotin carboxylase n=1 Tax=Kitasatospora atroaurantiaca TaxID=285545 RepID=A0A561ER38_9ACTN|nr:ATP-grasp domain-containing protein [Kitasatospora atroaurantiaca]TWE18070.1 biotin carboxylase [Kitasatospora atroaurantiaca]
MTELLLVGIGDLGLPYLIAAKRLQVGVRLVETAERAEPLRDLVDGVQLVPGTAEEQWADAALAAAAERAPDGVLGLGEHQVMAAALVGHYLGLPGPGLGAAVVSRNKALQRARFSSAGLPQPEFLVADSLAEAGEWAGARFPVVLKPLGGSGSSGVELVRDRAAYAEAVEHRAHDGRLLVESAARGPEYSWEGLVREGKVLLGNITAKETTGPPHFVETAHRVGGAPAHVERAGQQLGRDVVAALGLDTGIAHLEFRMTSAGPVIMEVAVRTPGDSIMDAVGLVHGLDMYEALVRLALGMPVPAVERAVPHGRSASLFPLARPGRVTAVTGLAEVREHPGVARVFVGVRPGDTVRPTTCSADRPAAVLLSADDDAQLERSIAHVRATLAIETVPEA